MDWNMFCENLKEVLDLKSYTESSQVKWNIDDTNILIKYYFEKNKVVEFTYTKRKFLNDSKNIQQVEELKVLSENYSEIPISFKNDYFPIIPRSYRLGREYDDDENNIKYKISTPSKQFWLKMIELKIKPNSVMMFRRLFIYERNYKFKDGVEKKDIFELLEIIYKDCTTLQISTKESYNENKFSELADAFIFNINYNMDLGIRQTYNVENIHERRKRNRFRNESLDMISAPRRIYKKELVEQYNMASMSDDPFIKYLCYYHILEHFYEAVYKENLINAVRDILTSPVFSIKKDNEITKLIETIKKKVKYDKEGVDINELEALELVIKKYIQTETLKDKIESIDSDLVNYYNTIKIQFSGGIPINFNDIDNLCKNIAKRIYYTRNALVHYKSNNFTNSERGIYHPFKDRDELLKEIPLIRILAEDVIINDAKII